MAGLRTTGQFGYCPGSDGVDFRSFRGVTRVGATKNTRHSVETTLPFKSWWYGMDALPLVKLLLNQDVDNRARSCRWNTQGTQTRYVSAAHYL